MSPYDPAEDAAARYPEWIIQPLCLYGRGEIVYPGQKLYLIDPDGLTKAEAISHAICHLDWGHVKVNRRQRFTRREEEDTDGLSEMRMTGRMPGARTEETALES